MIVNSMTRSLILSSKRLSVIRRFFLKISLKFHKNLTFLVIFSFESRVATYAKNAKEEQQLFWQKNQKLNRPVSPHLTIYKYQLIFFVNPLKN